MDKKSTFISKEPKESDAMTEDEKNNQIEEEIVEDGTEIDDEEYEGRDWKKVLTGVLFVLIVVVFWYIIEFVARN